MFSALKATQSHQRHLELPFEINSASVLFDKKVTQMSEAFEGRAYQWRSFGEDYGTHLEKRKEILRILLGPEENFVAGA